MDDSAFDAAVADEEIGAAADDACGDASFAAEADEVGEAFGGAGFDPELGRAADLHGGVAGHGFEEPDGGVGVVERGG